MTSNIKYVGMDVHKESISIAVRNAAGKIAMECVIETKDVIVPSGSGKSTNRECAGGRSCTTSSSMS
jgi:hypothetical protein